MLRLNSIRELDHLREHLRQQNQNYTSTISLCGGTGCQALYPGKGKRQYSGIIDYRDGAKYKEGG